jgi:NTE family protein
MLTAASGEKINLILSDGGARVAAYVGAVTALRDMGVEFGAIAGASAGSIVGAFLAAGWSSERMRSTVMETDFTRFKDFTLPGLIFEGTLYAGRVFERWLDEKLEGARFCDLPGDLFITAADVIGRESFFFSRYSTPQVAISKAIRCSMAVPGLWRPQRWEHRLLLDGQLMSWIRTGVDMASKCAPGEQALRTVIMRLVSDPSKGAPIRRHLWPWDFARILLETMLMALDNERVPAALWPDTILINTGNVPALRLKLTREAKEVLYRCGYDQARRYFNKRESTAGELPAVLGVG